MKKILYAAMLLLGLSILSSCGKIENTQKSETGLIGTWVLVKCEVYDSNGEIIATIENAEELRDEYWKWEFKPDNTSLLWESNYANLVGWNYDEKEGILYFWGSGAAYVIELTPSTMVLGKWNWVNPYGWKEKYKECDDVHAIWKKQ